MAIEIIIRPLEEGEKAVTQRVMRRAFPFTARFVFSWSEHVLVAERADRIIGGIVLKLFSVGERKVGFVSWLFTDPEAQGLGAGQALVEGALDFFAAQGCTEISACVEGYNTSSSKIFATRGFSLLSPGQQMRRYGWDIISYWWHTLHFMDVGNFLWVRPGAEGPDSPALQWLGTWIINTLLLWLVAWRQGTFASPILWSVPAALLALFGLRTLAMWTAAWAQGLAVRFRAWESSVPLITTIALLFGGYFPFPGSLYPRGDRWRYRDLLSKIGPMALAGSLVSLLLTGGSWAVLRRPLPPTWVPFWAVLFQVGKILALLDTVIAFFPVISYNGRRLWDWNRVVWALLSAAAIALLFLP